MSRPFIDLTGPEGRIIDAALALATERPWREVALRDIAERAGFSLVEMRQHFASKSDVLAAFARAVDDAVLSAKPQDSAEDPRRDALFEIVMARFDALSPYKTALRSIAKDTGADLVLLKTLFASQAWMLEAAGIATDGIEGGMRVAGLAAVYGSVYRTWLEDDDPGQARTMAALDRRLRRGERTLSTIDEVGRTLRGFGEQVSAFLSGAGRSGRASAPDADSETPPAAPRAGASGDTARQV
jgi:AcrR family transcriptional regulator